MSRVVNWYRAGVEVGSEPLVLWKSEDLPIKVLRGQTGMEMPRWTLIEDTTPGIDGAVFREAIVQPRDVTIPIYIRAATRDEFREIKSLMFSDFDPDSGPGKLEIIEARGTQAGALRYLNCTYAGGLEGDEGKNVGGNREWWLFTLQLRAHDPWFYSSLPTVAEWAGYAPVPFYPILPLQLSRSDVQEVVPFNGFRTDKPAWPTWEFQGPFTRAKVYNNRTNKWFEINRPTTASERIRIITQPGKVSLRELSQDQRIRPPADGSALFPINSSDAGQLTVTVDNATAATHVTLTAHARYRSTT